MRFIDRADAGRKLAGSLDRYRTLDPVILALPRGGVPVAAEIAKALNAPLDVVLVRKIGVPIQPELAAGAVVDADEPIVVRNREVIESTGLSEAAFNRRLEKERAEIVRRRSLYSSNRPHPAIKDRVVIVVDDGIATGATMQAALQGLRQRGPRKLVVATPVAPPAALARLKPLADEISCLETRSDFGAIGQFYDDFRQLDDADVIAVLNAPSA